MLNPKPPTGFIHDSITIPQMTTKTITAFVDHLSEWNTTGTVTPVGKFTETASLILSHSVSTISDRNLAVSVTDTTESPHTITNQQEHTNCGILRSHSGAIQVY